MAAQISDQIEASEAFENSTAEGHELNTDCDEASEQESADSSVDSTAEDVFHPALDRLSDASSSECWTPVNTPQKRKRSHMSSISPVKSKRSDLPVSAKKRRRKSGVTKSMKTTSAAYSLPMSNIEWQSVNEPDVEPAKFCFKPARKPGPQLVSTASYSPLQFFELFFSASVLNKIIKHSNAYGAKTHKEKRKPWVDITIKDFKSFLALVIYMGLLKCNTLADYWRTSHIYALPFPSRIMSRDKFMTISGALHLSDPKKDEENEKKKGTPEYDCLCKIKPLYRDIRDACMSSFHPFQNVSIDERMVASKARHQLKQYMKNKPTRWGYKLFVLADSSCGYTWDFFIYEGKANSGKSISYDSVMKLVNEKILGSGYKLYVDNFYTSPSLFRDLLKKNIWACGTLRANRIGHSKTPAPRGSIRWYRDNNLLFVEWKDKRDVLMCSTFHKAFSGETVKRKVKKAEGGWTIKDFPVPDAILDYNKNMGGVDLSDALICFYEVIHKTRKWYRSFFYHFVDIAIVNGFILYQQMTKTKHLKPLSQKAFRETLVAELAGTGPLSEPVKVQLAPSAALHMPQHFAEDGTTGRRRCTLCHRNTPIFCETCGVSLCIIPSRNCFAKWHKQSDE